MKVLALIGSPRKGGNTDILVDQILNGCHGQGHTTEKLYLYDYDISACVDCRRCKGNGHRCVLTDGMQKIYPKMESAEVLIFGTPIYWYGPTGKMKLLIDRMRPFIADGKLRGKTGIVATASEEGPSACEPLLQMFRMSFDYLGMKLGGQVLATAYEKGEVAQDREQLEKAYQLGASL